MARGQAVRDLVAADRPCHLPSYPLLVTGPLHIFLNGAKFLSSTPAFGWAWSDYL